MVEDFHLNFVFYSISNFDNNLISSSPLALQLVAQKKKHTKNSYWAMSEVDSALLPVDGFSPLGFYEDHCGSQAVSLFAPTRPLDNLSFLISGLHEDTVT